MLASRHVAHRTGCTFNGSARKAVVQAGRRPSLIVRCQLPNASNNGDGAASSMPSTNAGLNGPWLASAMPAKVPLLGWLQQHVPGCSPRRDVRTAAGGGDDSGAGGRGSGGGDNGGEGNGDDQGGDKGDKNEERILSLKEVEALAKEKGIQLPADMLEIAAKFGLRLTALNAFFSLQGSFFTGFIMRTFPYFRDRIIADPMFLFKVGAEVLIDSGCATVAEVRKRGKDFWAEFEFYLSDLFVGLVLDVVLVSLMAPAAVLGGASKAAMSTGFLAKLLANVPSAFFEANIPGIKQYGVLSRFACLGVKFMEYSFAGLMCGLIGQGVVNAMLHLKRQLHGHKEDDVAVPPLVKTAMVWGLFMGLSSNIRYQIVFGLERLVDTFIGKSFPPVAYASTVGIRFVNNVIGGENFIDMARYFGVQ